jgi:hypothetical protein
MMFATSYARPPIAAKPSPRSNGVPRIGTEPPPNAKNNQVMTYRSPVGGLKLFDDIAAVQDGGALVLDNWVCNTDTVRPRRGSEQRNTGISGGVNPLDGVVALTTYKSGSLSKLFAIGGTATHGIFDTTFIGAVGAAMVSGLTPVVWSFTQMATSGGVYLAAVGLGNARLLYDGASWATTPAITGISSSALSQVWLHGARMFFVEGNTTNAWYLASDSIGGAATKFPLGGLFRRGGTLIAGGTWTNDAGNSGLRSSCLFISSEGEIVVYEGDDPSSWSSIGTFFVGKPCGINCFLKTGGDVVVMTEDGLFAMSQVVSLDASALVNQSVSKDIRPLWRNAANATDKTRWQITRRDQEGYAVVHIPASAITAAQQFVVNLQTGGWSRWAGWMPTCFSAFNDELVFGTADGRIINGEKSGADLGLPYTSAIVLPFKMMDAHAVIPTLARAVVRSVETFSPKLTALFDYSVRLPSVPSAGISQGGSRWDEGLWDEAIWGGEKTAYQRWQAVSGIGSCVSLCVQYTMGQLQSPDIDFIRADLVMEAGEVVA